MIKQWLQDYLGITDIIAHHINMQRELKKANNILSTIGPGLGRVIAKLDPISVESEFDPKRKAESDRLADEVIRRLEAEAKARAPYNDPT